MLDEFARDQDIEYRLTDERVRDASELKQHRGEEHGEGGAHDALKPQRVGEVGQVGLRRRLLCVLGEATREKQSVLEEGAS